jgi:hypothetical protein
LSIKLQVRMRFYNKISHLECGSPRQLILQKGKITKDLIAMLSNWRHSGFNVFCGPRIQPGDAEAMENLARYIIRASFSQEKDGLYP